MKTITSKTELALVGRNYGKVEVVVSEYTDSRARLNGDGQLAVVLNGLDSFYGERIATATAYAGIIGPDAPYTLIKDYSENEGVFDWLISEGIIEPAPHWDTPSGFVTLKGAKVIHPELIA